MKKLSIILLFTLASNLLFSQTTRDIKQVFCTDGFFMKYKTSSKLIYDQKLVKRTTEGKIDIYSDYTTSYSNHMNANGTMNAGVPLTTYNELFFSKDKVTLLPIKYSTLMENLNDNQESMSHLQKYTTLNYVKYGFLTAGLITIISALAQIDKKEGLSSGAKSTLVIGDVVTNLFWIPLLMQDTCLKDAMNAYNK